MIQVIEGQPIGTHGLIVVKELSPIIHQNYKERRIEVLCPICKKPFASDLRRLTKKDTPHKKAVRCCPICMSKINNKRISELGKKTIQDISNQRFGNLIALYPTDKRGGNGYDVIWHCVCDCGTELDVLGQDLKRGHTLSCGCIKSRGEEKVAQILIQSNIKFYKQYTFNNCINPKTNVKLRFDFYLPEYNCCIEYDGIQHFKCSSSGWDTREDFENRVFRDKIKNQYCNTHNINLIRIPYWDFDNIDKDYLLDKLNFLL